MAKLIFRFIEAGLRGLLYHMQTQFFEYIYPSDESQKLCLHLKKGDLCQKIAIYLHVEAIRLRAVWKNLVQAVVKVHEANHVHEQSVFPKFKKYVQIFWCLFFTSTDRRVPVCEYSFLSLINRSLIDVSLSNIASLVPNV